MVSKVGGSEETVVTRPRPRQDVCDCDGDMKFVVVWLVIASVAGGSVLRCTSDSKDPICISDNQEKETPLKMADIPSGIDCAPKTTWQTECNTCMCNENGRSACTLIFCDDNESRLICAPGSKWKNACNMCQCTANGRPVCTKMDCETSSDILDPVNFEPELTEPEKETKNVHPNRVDNGHEIHKRSVCKPNQEFQNECNTCKCSGDGLSYSCSQNECLERDMTKDVEVFKENEGADHISHSVCKPRDTFPIGCNTCHCNLNGTDYSCTNKPCPLPDDVEFFHEPKTTSSKNKTVVCEANRSFKKGCNTCWCNEDGTSFFCTRRACVLPGDGEDIDQPEVDLRTIKQQCRPNEVFELDCNMCRCNPDGKSFSCTRRACDESTDDIKIDAPAILNRKTRASSQNCQPGTQFRMDCNTCLCDDEGKDFSCTRIDCNVPSSVNGNGDIRTKRETNEESFSLTERVLSNCTLGSVFNRGCGVCRCIEIGFALCTTPECPERVAKRTTTENPDPDADSNFRCNPGEQYTHDCNDCTCSADGRSVFCTLRLCDKSLSPH